jgi:16S rRNA (adenine1518-N6/adenine1519-N6)-dimethyltransferase
MDAPKKSLGQHWLNDPASLQAMLEAAEVQKQDTILEIGPGPGALTELLVKRAGHVIAIELDKKLAADLPKRLPVNNLDVYLADILSFDFNDLPPLYKIVANIPYYLTSHLIQLISETSNPPAAAALLVQKEVAERAAAKPGAMSLLSVTAQFYWQVSLGSIVPAALFIPPPKVDSQILILNKRPEPLFPDIDPKAFFRLVKAGFAQRRKTLLNSLSAGLHLSREQVQASLETTDIDPGRRAQTLSLEEWHQVYLILTR